MSLLDELSPASYKGAVFLMISASTAGGRKDRLHEFPNSDKQNVEDLGLLPKSFAIAGWITGPDYFAKRDALIAALESDSPGVLSHPLYGQLDNMKARPYSIIENLTELGRADFSMVFDLSDTLGIPEASDNTLALLNSSNDSVQASVNSEIVDSWNVDTEQVNNFTEAQDKLTDVNNAYEDSSNIIVKTTAKINEFNALISDFSSDINSLIQQPQALADSITNIGLGLNGLYATSEQQFEAWKNLFGFGDDNGIINTTTLGLAQRKVNNDAMNRALQNQALSFAYLAASQILYRDVSELDEFVAILETQFQKVIADETLSTTLHDSIIEMRENTNTFFDEVRVTLNRIITIRTPRLPARVIAHQYYGDSSLGEDIASLNRNANVSFLEGSIEILTQ